MSMNLHSVPGRPKNKLYFLFPPDTSEFFSQSQVPQTSPRIVTGRDSHHGLLTHWQYGKDEARRHVRERTPWHPPRPDSHCCGTRAGHFTSLSLCFFPCRTWTAMPSALEGLPGATFGICFLGFWFPILKGIFTKQISLQDNTPRKGEENNHDCIK